MQVLSNISSFSEVVSQAGVGLGGKEMFKNDVGRGKQNSGEMMMWKVRRNKSEEEEKVQV